MIFVRKFPKIGSQKGGKTSPNPSQIHFWPQGGPLGSPMEPKGTKMEPKGGKMTPRDPKKDLKYTVLGRKMNATNGTTEKKQLHNTIPQNERNEPYH